MKYYKVLGKNGVSCNGGTGKWNLPKDRKPGKWMPKIENMIPCERGYHLCRTEDLIYWLNEEIYEAQGRGIFIRHDNNKDVFPKARLIKKIEIWNDRTARLFAADCAEHVLPFFEVSYPNDDRPRKAIQAVRNFANGEISIEELAAARDAAWNVAGDAAGDAAWAAAGAAAWVAARDATRAAVRAAAERDAAGNAERKWQAERLFYYLEE